MPKYINTTSDLIVQGSLRFEPNDTLETVIWLSPLPSGITLLADAPYYDPIIVSQAVSSTSTVTIPAVPTGAYKVSVYVTAGVVSLKLNSDSGTARVLGVGMLFEAKCMARTINDLRFTISSGTAYVTVEKI